MKFQFTSKSKAQAEKFQKYVKADRNLESSLAEKDGKFFVEYSVADIMNPQTPQSTVQVGTADTVCYVEMDDMQDMLGSVVSYVMSEMQYQMNWLWAEIDYIESAFSSHLQGHLPAIKGADKMTKALDVLGIGGDYDVQKPVIYASTSIRGEKAFEVDFSPKK